LLFAWFGLKVGDKVPGAFYLIFAIAVTVSVQLVGVYLVFASLIIPALVTRKLSGNTQLIYAFSIGAFSYALGLAASALFDLPSGAVIVWSLAVSGVLGSVLMTNKLKLR